MESANESRNVLRKYSAGSRRWERCERRDTGELFKVGRIFTVAATAYNLVRMRNLLSRDSRSIGPGRESARGPEKRPIGT